MLIAIKVSSESIQKRVGSEESGNACDISGVNSPTVGSTIEALTYSAKGCKKYEDWSEKKIQTYNLTTKLSRQQTEQPNECKIFGDNLRAKFINMTKMKNRSSLHINATNNIGN